MVHEEEGGGGGAGVLNSVLGESMGGVAAMTPCVHVCMCGGGCNLPVIMTCSQATEQLLIGNLACKWRTYQIEPLFHICEGNAYNCVLLG